MPSQKERYERANWNLNIICSLSVIERDYPKPDDRLMILVLMNIRAWHHITYGLATVEHVKSSLSLSYEKINRQINRLRRRGWVARDGDYLALTDEGRTEERRIKAARSKEYKKYQRNLYRDGNRRSD